MNSSFGLFEAIVQNDSGAMKMCCCVGSRRTSVVGKGKRVGVGGWKS
jgi:hypothetical protein